VAATVGRDRVGRLLGVTAIVSAIGYVFTPSTALGPKGVPLLSFVNPNLRYLVPALVVAAAGLAAKRWGVVVVAVLVAVLVVELTAHSATTEPWLGVDRLAAAVTAVGVAAALGLVVALRQRPPLAAWGTAALLVAAGIAFTPVQRHYGQRRYNPYPAPLAAQVAWAR